MDSETDPIIEYKQSLNELSFNSKPLINMLTMLSEDYKDSKAPQIVKCVEQRLHSVSADKKLAILYLLDSICKNVGQIYIKLFTQNIVSTFCDVFEKVDEKTRLSLYKLRQTWSSIFPPRKLYAIDTRIHNKLDPAWPITAPKPDAGAVEQKNNQNNRPMLQSVVKQTAPLKGSMAQSEHKPQQQVHINPKFFTDPALHPSGPEAEVAKQLIQKQNELLQLQKQKLEFEMLNEKRRLAETARALQEKEEKLKQKEQMLRLNSSPNTKKSSMKKRKRSRSHRSRSPSPINQKNRSPGHRWSQSPNERIRESPQPMGRQQSPSFANRQNNSHRPRSRSPSAVKPFIPQQSVVSLPNQPSGGLSSNIMSTGGGQQPPVPTTIPAPTILAQPEMLTMSQHMDSNVSTTMSSMRPIVSGLNVMSGHMNNNSERAIPYTSWGKDRDYRKEFDSMMSDANEKLRSGVISSADHDVLVREVERQLTEAQKQSIMYTNSAATNVCEPQDTFTMLVDGKLRKLFYLDDTTAVVLLNAPQNADFRQLISVDPKVLDPRQISFEGKPTKVFIDSERGCHDFVMLEFNGQQKTFYTNGGSSPQRIKFGGPAKEIILNGQSYPAKFGGPPITVWFEGDSSGPHSLKLDGPTPRVKLSDERRFDLWSNIIKKSTNPPNNAMNTAPTVQPKPDMNSLLSKLIAAGMIGNNTKTESMKTLQKEVKSVTKKQKRLSIDPSIELTSESLKLSRPSVLPSLYDGIQCTNCSLRFDDIGGQSDDKNRYSKHLDWHFRQNRRDKAKPNSTANSMRRNWYYPLNLWVQFKEVTDEEEMIDLFRNEEQETEVEEVIPMSTEIAEKDESLNFCAVCGEKFDQNWNEEEEEWRLNNAVKHNHKIYHPLCLKDFFTQNERLEQQLNESLSETETKPNLSEESIQLKVTEDLDKSESNCDNSLSQELDESVVKTEEQMETNISETDVKKETTEEEIPVLSESTEDSNIKVFEFEIPLNNDDEVRHELVDILDNKEVTETEPKMECTEEEKSDEKVVTAKGGIVIKMKSSNLPTQTTVQTSEPMETMETQESEVIVRGHEMSYLCNIL